jgi:hypothetical protein
MRVSCRLFLCNKKARTSENAGPGRSSNPQILLYNANPAFESSFAVDELATFAGAHSDQKAALAGLFYLADAMIFHVISLLLKP